MTIKLVKPKPKSHNNFGDLLRQERLAHGLSIYKLATILEVQISYISEIERGLRPPPREEIIKKIAKCFNESEGIFFDAANLQRGYVILNFEDDKCSIQGIVFATELARVWPLDNLTLIQMRHILHTLHKGDGRLTDGQIEE